MTIRSFPISSEELDIFTPLQRDVLLGKFGHTYEELINMFEELSTPKQIKTILSRTLRGFKWSPGEKGRMGIVGDVQMERFKNEVRNAADHNHAITMFEAISILEQIQGDYLWLSYQRAMKMGCPKLAQDLLLDMEPVLTPQWFTNILKKWNIQVKSANDLEETRNKYCHSRVIQQFYNNLIQNLPKNGDLLFNADETASTFSEKGKVLVPDGRFPVRYGSTINAHYTTICCFNAAGSKILPPFIILPKLRKIPDELKTFMKQAMFASSPTGWITNKLFVAFAMFFCHHISEFRLRTQINDTIWLILDGHKSRINSLAIEYFVDSNVSVLILPSHTSHVTQPFDVGISSPLKTRIRSFISKPPSSIRLLLEKVNTHTAKERILIIAGIINSWYATATPGNCSSAFLGAGIFPYNVDLVLENRYVRSSDENDVEAPERGIRINSTILTSNEKRIEIANYCHKPQRPFQDVSEIPRYSTQTIVEWLKEGSEIILMDLPPFFIQVLPGITFHL